MSAEIIIIQNTETQVIEVVNPGIASLVGSVRYDVAQTLSSPQKAQVWANIGGAAAVLATTLAGFSSSAGGTVTSADSILVMAGKFEHRLADLEDGGISGPYAITANSASPTLTLVNNGAGLALYAADDVRLASSVVLAWEDSPGVVGPTLRRDVDGVILSDREIRMSGSGTGALFGVQNTSGTANAFATDVVGDALNRFIIDVNGRMSWGSGAAGADAALYRASASALQTTAAFTVADTLTIGGANPVLAGPGTTGAITVKVDGSRQLRLARTTGTKYLELGVTAGAVSSIFAFNSESPYVETLALNPDGGMVTVGGGITVTGLASVTANSASTALTVTQSGAGAAILMDNGGGWRLDLTPGQSSNRIRSVDSQPLNLQIGTTTIASVSGSGFNVTGLQTITANSASAGLTVTQNGAGLGISLNTGKVIGIGTDHAYMYGSAAAAEVGTSTNSYKIVVGGGQRAEFKNTTVNLTLPTSSAGLASGDLWNDSGTVKVA